jgi:hypothetical protein
MQRGRKRGRTQTAATKDRDEPSQNTARKNKEKQKVSDSNEYARIFFFLLLKSEPENLRNIWTPELVNVTTEREKRIFEYQYGEGCNVEDDPRVTATGRPWPPVQSTPPSSSAQVVHSTLLFVHLISFRFHLHEPQMSSAMIVPPTLI